VKKRLVILGCKKWHEQLKRCVQTVMENERFVSRYRRLLVQCRLLVHVMCVDEYEKFIKKAEKYWEMDD
jgi:hypothetical protein